MIIICCLISFWFNLKLSAEVKRNADIFTRSESILRHSGQIRITILDMDNAFRGFLLTDNEKFLTPYYAGVDSLPQLFLGEKNLINSSPKQLAMFDSIELIHRKWLAYSQEIISAKFDRIDPNIVSFEYDTLLENKLKKEVGKRLVEEINEKLNRFELYEYEASRLNRENLKESMTTAKSVSLTLSIVTLLVGVIGAFYITHVITKRIKSMVKLAENISEGNFNHITDNKDDELTKLSHSLNVMSEKLKRSFFELDQYARVVSHDLKAPLRGINNVISWIAEDFSKEMSPVLVDYFEKIKGRALRMENLISGLLEYSKIRGTKDIEEQVDVRILLDEIVDSIVPSDFKVNIQKPMPVLYTVKVRLQQVFSNLISNAVKYNESEQGQVWVSCIELPLFYEFTVRDNGVGIAPEHQEKIFGIFQTLRDRDDKESTGIGLSIVKKIIEVKSGKLRVESSVGKGTSFIFTWPK